MIPPVTPEVTEEPWQLKFRRIEAELPVELDTGVVGVRINPGIKETATTRAGIIEFGSEENITKPIVYHELFHRHLDRMSEVRVKQLFSELNTAVGKGVPETALRFETEEQIVMGFEQYVLGRWKPDNPVYKVYEKWFPKTRAIPKAGVIPVTPEITPVTSTHPLILQQYPIGEVPEKMPIGGLEVPVPPPKVVSENAAIRTDEKLDKTVEHLGYQSITLSEEELASLDRAIPTDVDIVSEAQRRLKDTEVIPDSKLDAQQLAHLNLARAIASHTLLNNPVLGVYAAIIPPASDRVRTAGMYGTSTKAIYISLDILPRCRSTVDTLVHELGHHQQHTKEDLTPAHAEAMTDVAARVVEDVAKGAFDNLLKEVVW